MVSTKPHRWLRRAIVEHCDVLQASPLPTHHTPPVSGLPNSTPYRVVGTYTTLRQIPPRATSPLECTSSTDLQRSKIPTMPLDGNFLVRFRAWTNDNGQSMARCSNSTASCTLYILAGLYLLNDCREDLQMLFIMKLLDPTTAASKPVEICRPNQPWEHLGHIGICEGPQWLEAPDGSWKGLVYSCSASWTKDYKWRR